MKHGKMTRDQAIAVAGKEIVDKLDYENCEPTSRCQTDGDDSVEFSAALRFVDADGDSRCLTAYYYQQPEALEGVEDLGSMDWEINGYEIA